MEINVWHKRTGFHSALIVDHEPKCDAYRITNFKEAATHDGWLFAEDLYQFLGSGLGFSGYTQDKNRCRLFALKGTSKIKKKKFKL